MMKFNVLLLLILGVFFINSIQSQEICVVYVSPTGSLVNGTCGGNQSTACNDIQTALSQCNSTTSIEIIVYLVGGNYDAENNSGTVVNNSTQYIQIKAVNISNPPTVIIDLTNATQPFVSIDAAASDVLIFTLDGISFVNSNNVANASASPFGSIVDSNCLGSCNITITNCHFSENKASYLFSFSGNTSNENQVPASINNSQFYQNYGTIASIYTTNGASSQVDSCFFNQNMGAIYSVDSGFSGSITNTQFTENSFQSTIGGIISFQHTTGANTISNVTFTGNSFPNPPSNSVYSVIFSSPSNLTIQNSIFTENQGTCLFFFEDSIIQVQDTNFTGNSDKNGHSIVSSNMGVTFQFDNCLFQNNTVTDGSVLYSHVPSSPSFLTNCQFIDNTVSTSALNFQGQDNTTQEITLTNVILQNNTATGAGALQCENIEVITNNVVLADNTPSNTTNLDNICGIDSSLSCVVKNTNLTCTSLTSSSTHSNETSSSQGSSSGSSLPMTDKYIIAFIIPVAIILSILVIMVIYSKCKGIDSHKGYQRINDSDI